MKKSTLLTLLMILNSLFIYSQNIVGSWEGILNVNGYKLPIVFNISETNIKTYDTNLDSPTQNTFGISADSTFLNDSILFVSVKMLNANFNGVIKNDSVIKGVFNQNGMTLPLSLKKGRTTKKEVFKRPQTPKKPYPYIVEEITFKNTKADINLAGTLTLPSTKGKFSVVILISGSGAQNRDSEFFNHKPFLVLADYLTKNGIAVLRYDERGVGKSEGSFKNATSEDFKDDVDAAYHYLLSRKDIKHKKIGLIGHSEGGMIAPMFAKDHDISFIVLMAAPGIPIKDLMVIQNEKVGEKSGMSSSQLTTAKRFNKELYNIIINTNDSELENKLTDYLKSNGIDDKTIKNQINQLSTPWFQYFINYNPEKNLQSINCPVLAINGEEDIQVTSIENLNGIKNTVNNNLLTLKSYPNLNHLFQQCTSCTINEYQEIEETISPIVLEDLVLWIQQQTK